jgi:hypothetical protein
VHLRAGERGGEGCGAEDYAVDERSHGSVTSANEFRRCLLGKVVGRG